MERNKTVTGACHFCGQTAMVTLTEDEWLERIRDTGLPGDDVADILAQEECNCAMGEEWRHDCQMIKECGRNIEEMFREQHPDIADLLQQAKAPIWKRDIRKITVSTYEDGTASMYRHGGNMEIRFVKKNETKLTVSEK